MRRKLTALLIVNQGSDKVTGKEIRGKLNTTKIYAQGLSQSAHRKGFGQSRNPLNENVSIAKQGYQQTINQIAQTNYNLANFLSY